MLDHVNSKVEQSRRNHIAGCLDSQYRRLSENVLLDSEWLFDDDITKIFITVRTN